MKADNNQVALTNPNNINGKGNSTFEEELSIVNP